MLQLHPQAYRFAPGHAAKLELLPSDAPYARPSNAQAPITVSNLELRLPVLEQPGSLGGLVQPPAPKILPPGYQLAIDYRAGGGSGAPSVGAGAIALGRGRILATANSLLVRLHCVGDACSGRLSVSVAARAGRRALASGAYSIPGGRTSRLRLPLGKAGRRIVATQRRRHRGRRAFPARLAFSDSGRPTLFELTRPIHLKRG